MAASLHQAPEVWERVSDSKGEEASSTTTLLGVGVSERPWTPTVSGSLGSRCAQGTQPEQSYAAFRDGAQSMSEWSWSWSSESWSSEDWSVDPWGRHLDEHRPGWHRHRKQENWDENPFEPHHTRHERKTGKVEDVPSTASWPAAGEGKGECARGGDE